MTADAAHVAAVAEALFARGQVSCEFHGGTLYDDCASCCGLADELHRDATVAVETLTPLIRAQVAAERDALAAKVRAVEALHQETFGYAYTGARYSRNRCTCERAWPCPTRTALATTEGTP